MSAVVTKSALLEHFERISEAPDAVAKLRHLVLDLAVSGRLVEQKPHDEPAKALLRRIEIEKARNGVVDKPGLPGREEKSTAIPLPLPPGWAATTLRQLTTSITDGDHLPPPKTDEGIPFLVIGDVRSGRLSFANCRHVSEEYYDLLDTSRKPRRGDILYTLVGSFGIPVFVAEERPFCVQRHIGILRPSNEIDAIFLTRVLASKLTFDQAARCATGIAQKTVPLAGLRRIALPLPPLAEQHRIVAKVDDLMALCDELEAAQTKREKRRDRLVAASLHALTNGEDSEEGAGQSREQAARFYLNLLPRLTTRPEHIHQLRQTILDLAVRGRLVHQFPGDGPAILSAPRPATRCPAASISAPPTRHLPENWSWFTIRALLAEDSRNGLSRKPDDDPHGVPILRISAGTTRPDLIVAENECKRIGSVSPAERLAYGLRPGDLLACRFNGNRSFVGRVALFRGHMLESPMYPDKLIRLRVNTRLVLPELVRYFAASDLIRSDVLSRTATTVGNWGISAAALKDVWFPLPPLAEQRRIVAAVDGLTSLCDQLEGRLLASRAGAVGLAHRTLCVDELPPPAPGAE